VDRATVAREARTKIRVGAVIADAMSLRLSL
jgi:hypothetical protein